MGVFSYIFIEMTCDIRESNFAVFQSLIYFLNKCHAEQCSLTKLNGSFIDTFKQGNMLKIGEIKEK